MKIRYIDDFKGHENLHCKLRHLVAENTVTDLVGLEKRSYEKLRVYRISVYRIASFMRVNVISIS